MLKKFTRIIFMVAILIGGGIVFSQSSYSQNAQNISPSSVYENLSHLDYIYVTAKNYKKSQMDTCLETKEQALCDTIPDLQKFSPKLMFNVSEEEANRLGIRFMPQYIGTGYWKHGFKPENENEFLNIADKKVKLINVRVDKIRPGYYYFEKAIVE